MSLISNASLISSQVNISEDHQQVEGVGNTFGKNNPENRKLFSDFINHRAMKTKFLVTGGSSLPLEAIEDIFVICGIGQCHYQIRIMNYYD
jgi:hypothetical protein